MITPRGISTSVVNSLISLLILHNSINKGSKWTQGQGRSLSAEETFKSGTPLCNTNAIVGIFLYSHPDLFSCPANAIPMGQVTPEIWAPVKEDSLY